MAEPELNKLLAEYGFSIANLSYRVTDDGKTFEYRMVIKSRDRKAADRLAQTLSSRADVVAFRISPTGD